MRVCMVTNIPAPYREPIHELVSHKIDSYHVIYCQDREENREWEFHLGNYSHSFLNKCVINYKGRFIHINPDVWLELNRRSPDIVITTGFNPTHLISFLWCVINCKKHICMTDGWIGSESNLSSLHRIVRNFVFKNSIAFIGASKHSLDLYRSYSCADNRLFQSHLCANNEYFSKFIHEEKKYDIMFSGQFINRKMPYFFCEVAKKINEKKNSCKALILGKGPLKDDFLSCLERFGIDYHYAGFVQQDELPIYYASSRILLFPTLNDPWGLVANEACASGIPVITCENAGVSNDLIQHGKNGLILSLNPNVWADAVVKLLDDPILYDSLSKRALSSVQRFNYEVAAQGIIDAAIYVCNQSILKND